MELRIVRIVSAATILACLILYGCSSQPTLLPRSATAPTGVDFSGQWLLRVDANTSPRSLPGRTPGVESPIQETKRRRRSSSRRSSSVQLFLETGESLKVTQTSHGFFVSVDRSIVEEFTFGENRVVSIGPIDAQRVSGWQGAAYIVETLDDSGAILKEAWSLDEGGDVLLRDISIVERGKETLSLQQQFDRQ